MGNRAYVIFLRNSDKPEHQNGIANWSPEVYLHWNGGPESACRTRILRKRIRLHKTAALPSFAARMRGKQARILAPATNRSA
jgi:hypothetical protein